jgi:glycosyltransferase involved in cell wall biosynthesis
MQLESAVRFLGNRSDVPDWYQMMDVFVMPSYYEGFPVVGVEAQAAGLLCLFADTITSEIKISPKAFFVSLDEGIENWANRIEQMLRSQSERNNLILEHERFDITKNANKLDRFYRRRIEDLK